MKILFIVSRLTKSGPSNQLLYICRYLKADNEITILTLSSEKKSSLKESFVNDNINIQCLELSFIKLFSFIKFLRLSVGTFKPDIIHTQGIRPDLILSLLNKHIPHVITIRNYPFDDYPKKYNLFIGIIMSIIHIIIFKISKNTVCCSHSLHNKLSHFMIKSLVIRNGTNKNEYKCEKNLNNDSIKNKFIIAVVGELNSRKNVNFILEVFVKYKSLNNFELRIFGDGPLLEQYNQTYSRYSNIKFYGYTDNVCYELSQCSCFVSCSKSEGYPNSVIEALCCGLPVILSDIPSHQEIYSVIPDFVKIYSDSFSLKELLEYYSNNFNLHKRNDLSRIAIENFDSNIMASKYLNLYHKILR